MRDININKANGSILIGNYSVSASTCIESFQESEIGKSAKELVNNPPWLTLQANQGKWTCSLVFEGSRLREVRLYSPSKKLSGWSDWSRDDQILEKEKNDLLLRENLGRLPYNFEWGSVESVFDNRIGVSEIIIRYSWK